MQNQVKSNATINTAAKRSKKIIRQQTSYTDQAIKVAKKLRGG